MLEDLISAVREFDNVQRLEHQRRKALSEATARKDIAEKVLEDKLKLFNQTYPGRVFQYGRKIYTIAGLGISVRELTSINDLKAIENLKEELYEES